MFCGFYSALSEGDKYSTHPHKARGLQPSSNKKMNTKQKCLLGVSMAVSVIALILFVVISSSSAAGVGPFALSKDVLPLGAGGLSAFGIVSFTADLLKLIEIYTQEGKDKKITKPFSDSTIPSSQDMQNGSQSPEPSSPEVVKREKDDDTPSPRIGILLQQPGVPLGGVPLVLEPFLGEPKSRGSTDDNIAETPVRTLQSRHHTADDRLRPSPIFGDWKMSQRARNGRSTRLDREETPSPPKLVRRLTLPPKLERSSSFVESSGSSSGRSRSATDLSSDRSLADFRVGFFQVRSESSSEPVRAKKHKKPVEHSSASNPAGHTAGHRPHGKSSRTVNRKSKKK